MTEPKSVVLPLHHIPIPCDHDGARTHDLEIKSFELYQLSYVIDPDYYYFEFLTSVIILKVFRKPYNRIG